VVTLVLGMVGIHVTVSLLQKGSRVHSSMLLEADVYHDRAQATRREDVTLDKCDLCWNDGHTLDSAWNTGRCLEGRPRGSRWRRRGCNILAMGAPPVVGGAFNWCLVETAAVLEVLGKARGPVGDLRDTVVQVPSEVNVTMR
jgi:hypothetical protein